MRFIRKLKSMIGQRINAADTELNLKSFVKNQTHHVELDAYVEPKKIRLIRAREFDQLRAILLKKGSNSNLDLDLDVSDALLDKHRLNKMHHPAKTLKKIDEIEAEMSKLWWSTVRLDLLKSNSD